MSVSKFSVEEKMFGLVEKCQSGNTTTKLFCKEHGLAEHVYYYWQRKYRSGQRPPEFIPLEIHQTTGAISGEVSISYPNGVCVSFTGGASIQDIKALLNIK